MSKSNQEAHCQRTSVDQLQLKPGDLTETGSMLTCDILTTFHFLFITLAEIVRKGARRTPTSWTGFPLVVAVQRAGWLPRK